MSFQRLFVILLLLCSILHATAAPAIQVKRRALSKAPPAKPPAKASPPVKTKPVVVTTKPPVVTTTKPSVITTTKQASTSTKPTVSTSASTASISPVSSSSSKGLSTSSKLTSTLASSTSQTTASSSSSTSISASSKSVASTSSSSQSLTSTVASTRLAPNASSTSVTGGTTSTPTARNASSTSSSSQSLTSTIVSTRLAPNASSTSVTATATALNASSTSTALSPNSTAVNGSSTAPVACLLPTKRAVAAPVETGLIANKFMVLLNDNVNPQTHLVKVQAAINSTASCGGSVKSSITNTKMLATAGYYSATLSPAMEAFLQKNPDVQILEQDATASLSGPVRVRVSAIRRTLTAFQTTWNIFRLTQPGKVSPGSAGQGSALGVRDWPTQQDPTAGQGVDIYIVDSGINPHDDIKARLMPGINTIDDEDENDTSDKLGHGTSVAGVAAGTNSGIAKGANIIPIKITNTEETTNQAFIDGMTEVGLSVAQTKRPSVMNISGHVVRTKLALRVLKKVQKAGVHVVVAAGNGEKPTEDADEVGVNACGLRLGTADGVINVGATDSEDKQTSFSNFGSCLDLFAPGEFTITPSFDDLTTFQRDDGTSFAAPAVAGVVATLLAKNTALSLPDMKAAVLKSTVHAVQLLPPALADQTPDLMLQIPKS